jgi:hypothetical protein
MSTSTVDVIVGIQIIVDFIVKVIVRVEIIVEYVGEFANVANWTYCWIYVGVIVGDILELQLLLLAFLPAVKPRSVVVDDFAGGVLKVGKKLPALHYLEHHVKAVAILSKIRISR